MRFQRHGLALALAVLLAAPPAAAAPGDLDPSFGTGGKFLLSVGPHSANINAAVKQADGKIVVAGFAEQSATDPFNRDFLVARFHADGTLDTSFNASGGQPGVRTTPVTAGTANDTAYALALGPGDTIYVAGSTDPDGADSGDFALVRYTSAGLVDTSFSTDGIQTHSLGSFDSANGVAVQAADGKPILAGARGDAGFQVLRLDSVSGALDTSYNAAGTTPGVQDVSFGGSFSDTASAIALQSDGKAVVAGTAGASTSESNFALARLNTDGTLDTAGFGAGTGKVETSLPNFESARALALAGERILLAGETLSATGPKDFMLARYLGDGSPDTSFSGDGVQVTPFTAADGTRFASATSVMVEDGKVLAGGWAFNCPGVGCADFAAARYLDDGNLDPGFGTGGKRTYPIGSGNDFATAAVPGSFVLFGYGFDGVRERVAGAKITTAGGKYDLEVSLAAPREVGLLEKTFTFTVFVENTGSASATSPQADVRFVAYPVSADRVRQVATSGGVSACAVDSPTGFAIFKCIVPPLTPRAGATISYEVPAQNEFYDMSASVRRTGSQDCLPLDEVACDNNATGRVTTRIPVPISRIKSLGVVAGLLGVTGSSVPSSTSGGSSAGDAHAAARGPKVKRVEIALLRRRGRIKAAAAPRCLWLRNRRARFKRVKPGAGRVCDRPVWLRVRGTKRWRFKTTRRLPRGLYVAYARAIDRAGHRTSKFTRKRRNRVAFKIGRHPPRRIRVRVTGR